MNTSFNNYLDSLTPSRRNIAMEAIKAYNESKQADIKDVGTATRVYNFCSDLVDEEVEHAVVLLMNRNYKLIKRVEIGRGGLTEVTFDIRLVLREALINNATIICMVHNHPSGSITPSKMDDNLTKDAKRACDIMRIHLNDHVIIGAGQYYSYREAGRI